jgi:DNA helicase II / ATP-dependent DNA helicase PcrA
MPANKKFIADFHIHSHYSLATSKNLIPEHLDTWARIKGIDVIGTGDCIHPGWLKELKEKLEPAENGLFRLKKEYFFDKDKITGKHIPKDIFFILTGEISNIYKKGGKVRKVHNLCVFPDFEAVEYVQRSLKGFNIESDGRPILGLDSKFLLEIVLQSSEKSFLVPAHIWTPWFSVLGSKSGFDSVKECYDDLTANIFAVETGLSSDPAMNRVCSFLDGFKLISNSDAHSPEKLGREANLFNAELSYNGIYNALKGDSGFEGTIEFFPQEGKYHYDGHRKCNICYDPLETLKNNGICPVCLKPLTIGVMYRVAELADRDVKIHFDNKKDFFSITSLPDLLAELMDKKSNSNKSVQSEYLRLIRGLGSEFHILLFEDFAKIKETGGDLLSEGIKRLRQCNVIIEEGYDGEFGRIKVFNREELLSFSGVSLFSEQNSLPSKQNNELSVKFNIKEFQALKETRKNTDDISETQSGKKNSILSQEIKLSKEQIIAVEHFDGPCMVLAGPGSGKTRILTERIIYLVSQKGIKPENILAITFTNKAAGEIQERLKQRDSSFNANIMTFHAFGLSILKKHFKEFNRNTQFFIADHNEKKEILIELTGRDSRKADKELREFEKYKQGISAEIDPDLFRQYNESLEKLGAFDIDDLIYLPVELFKKHAKILNEYKKKYRWILIDEYQDINAKQFEMILLLAENNNPDLFAIGDPDQAIYGFRGSDVKYVEKFRELFPDLKLVNLHNSYRCPNPVVKAATQIFGRKSGIKGKDENVKIHVMGADSDNSEADWIAAQIEKMLGGVRSFSIDSGISDGEALEQSAGFSDFAVLCRTSLMFDPILKAFSNHGVACQVIGTEPFYYKEPFNTIISNFRKIYFNSLNNNKMAVNLADKIKEMTQKNELIYKIFNFMTDNINKFVTLADDAEMSGEVAKQMQELAMPFGNDYQKFFNSIFTRQGIDDFNENAEAVSLMTIHASKGLEFNTVFIPGCEEGIIPFELFGKKADNELAEEERLFYVGMTRTKKNLFLTHSKKRFIKNRLLNQGKSRFLERLEKELLKSGEREKKKKKPGDDQMDLFDK